MTYLFIALTGLGALRATECISQVVYAKNEAPSLSGASATLPSWYDQYVVYLWKVENPNKVGFNNYSWATYDDSGTPAIGPGIRVGVPCFYSNSGIAQLIKTTVILHINRAKLIYDKAYGVGSFNQLNAYKQMALTDIDYNPGLIKFPKFMSAVHNNDWVDVQKEGIRYSNGKALSRNKEFFNLIEKGFN